MHNTKIQHGIILIIKRKIKYHSFTQIGISFNNNHFEQVHELNSVCNEKLSSEAFYSVAPFNWYICWHGCFFTQKDCKQASETQNSVNNATLWITKKCSLVHRTQFWIHISTRFLSCGRQTDVNHLNQMKKDAKVKCQSKIQLLF